MLSPGSNTVALNWEKEAHFPKIFCLESKRSVPIFSLVEFRILADSHLSIHMMDIATLGSRLSGKICSMFSHFVFHDQSQNTNARG